MTDTASRLKACGGVLGLVLVGGTAGFALLEGVSLADALYFTVVTVATVGYGDIHPITAGGKLLAVAMIIIGVGTFLAVMANATDVLLARRQERVRRERLSMVISLFFSEIGTQLLRLVAASDPGLTKLRDELGLHARWSGTEFETARKCLQLHQWDVKMAAADLGKLSSFLDEKSSLLLRLLGNQNLLEHESFTDLLRAVFHLKEELLSRPEFENLPESDLAHLRGDVKRVYPLLARQWLSHLEFLSANYPYLYSLAVRTNPLVEQRPPIVQPE